MTATDWLCSLINASLGVIVVVIVAFVSRLVVRVRRQRPWANRRFLRQYRAERAFDRTAVTQPSDIVPLRPGNLTRTPGRERRAA